MTDKTALRQLIEAVEVGGTIGLNVKDVCRALGWRFPDMRTSHILAAEAGSLDAAKAMHDALLPGWEFGVRSDGQVFFSWVNSPDYEVCTWIAGDKETTDVLSGSYHSGVSDNPARSWLIAILKAYEAQQ